MGAHRDRPDAHYIGEMLAPATPSTTRTALADAAFEARHQAAQAELLALLQADTTGKQLERLAAALIADLVGVPVFVARSGFQHGGDAGPAGHSGRRFRIETKKYAATTELNQRELLGEVEQALSLDPALEAWVLVATRPVHEQLRQALVQKGEKDGVPILILPWEESGLTTLAALCASSPATVKALVSDKAGDLATTLAEVAAPRVEAVVRDLSVWAPGFEALRRNAHEKLDALWSVPRASLAQFAQDAAVGARSHRVSREGAKTQFDAWWAGPAAQDAPLAVVGLEGVGKTWAVIDWLHAGLSAQTIVLTIPSAAVAGLGQASVAAVKRLIAERLQLVTGVRDSVHWARRLEALLKRPADEGPVLTLFLDGINQEASTAWPELLMALQGPEFEGRVRVVLSTREHHFRMRLKSLKGLAVTPTVARIDDFDLTPGGEFDQMLAFEGLSRDELGEELVDRARNPRLFGLVVRLKDKLKDGRQVTLHRLLWEYGRHSLGARGRSFSEDDWREWLRGLAGRWRRGERPQTTTDLGATVARADLAPEDVAARLSDIIDGRFVTPTGDGVEVAPVVVGHALGLGLLDRLSRLDAASPEALEADLNDWLDPISGLDQRAEILRAAVSIGLERDEPVRPAVLSVLVTAWLQSQNISDAHRDELAGLAGQLIEPLLDAAEASEGHTLRSARLWAVNAIRSADSSVAIDAPIMRRCATWFDTIPLNPDGIDHEEFKQRRLEQYRQRIGRDKVGDAVVLGREVRLIEGGESLTAMAPSVMEGRPLAAAIDVFEAAALNLAIARRCDAVDGLGWLIQLNPHDAEDARRELRERAADLTARPPEAGVDPRLAGRAAANLLRLSGAEIDDLAAEEVDTDLEASRSYERDYLADPAKSFYELERRHADSVLASGATPFHIKLSKARRFWSDPGFSAPEEFRAELAAAAAAVDPAVLHRHSSATLQDHNFEELAPALAREHPGLLADIGRRNVLSARDATADQRAWAALGLRDEMVLHDAETAEAVHALRMSGRELDDGREAHASAIMLSYELQGPDAFEQAKILLGAGLKYVLVELSEVLKPLSAAEVDQLLAQFGSGSAEQQSDLLVIISVAAAIVSDDVWRWIETRAETLESDARGFAFQVLAQLDALRWGERLKAQGWSWDPADHVWANHFGSVALVEATRGVEFEAVAERIAPWRLGAAVVQRGEDIAEARFAADILSEVILRDGAAPELGAQITVAVGDDGEHEPISVSLEETEDEARGAEGLRLALDGKAQLEALNRASRVARERIREARRAGASLYLTEIQAKHLIPLVRAAPDAVSSWLDGMAQLTPDFRRRVHLAESAYLALCEALMAARPSEGAALWRALRIVLRTRWLGRGGVEELLHIPFRAPPSTDLAQILDELRSLAAAPTDRALSDLVFAAEVNGRSDWVDSWRDEEVASGVSWRELRATVIDGMRAVVDLPGDNSWPEGPPGTRLESLLRAAADARRRTAAARHWWRRLRDASTGQEAYAAWWLYAESTSTTDDVWLRDPEQQLGADAPLRRPKLSQMILSAQELKRKREKRDEKGNGKFLGRSIWKGIGPWTAM